MKSWLLGSVWVLASCCVSVALAQVPKRQTPQAPTWLADYDAARETARRSGKPLFVVFR
jgi:hypothetical protein